MSGYHKFFLYLCIFQPVPFHIIYMYILNNHILLHTENSSDTNNHIDTVIISLAHYTVGIVTSTSCSSILKEAVRTGHEI